MHTRICVCSYHVNLNRFITPDEEGSILRNVVIKQNKRWKSKIKKILYKIDRLGSSLS